jgi:hypothetical protein
MYTKLEDSPILERGDVEIWYSKTLFGGEEADPSDLEKTHVKLGAIKAQDAEDAWRKMQGEFWSPNGEARDLILGSGLCHTSMSVGDIIVIDGVKMKVSMLGFDVI